MTAAPLHLVLGDEELLVERAVTAVVRAVIASSRSSHVPVAKLRAGEVATAELIELLSPSLFAEDRVVVLTNADEAGKESVDIVTDAVQQPPEGATLVIVHSGGGRAKALAEVIRRAGATVHTCPKIQYDNERIDFVRGELRTAGVRASADVIRAIVDGVGSDVRELAAAVSQLAADTGGKLDVAAVERYHRGKADVSGFEVADKTVEGDRTGALEAVRWALHAGYPHVLLADALARGLHTIARVAPQRNADPFRLAGQLKLSKFQVQKAQRQASGWTPRSIARAIEVAARLNADVKGAAADPNYAVEAAVAEILALRGA